MDRLTECEERREKLIDVYRQTLENIEYLSRHVEDEAFLQGLKTEEGKELRSLIEKSAMMPTQVGRSQPEVQKEEVTNERFDLSSAAETGNAKSLFFSNSPMGTPLEKDIKDVRRERFSLVMDEKVDTGLKRTLFEAKPAPSESFEGVKTTPYMELLLATAEEVSAAEKETPELLSLIADDPMPPSPPPAPSVAVPPSPPSSPPPPPVSSEPVVPSPPIPPPPLVSNELIPPIPPLVSSESVVPSPPSPPPVPSAAVPPSSLSLAPSSPVPPSPPSPPTVSSESVVPSPPSPPPVPSAAVPPSSLSSLPVKKGPEMTKEALDRVEGEYVLLLKKVKKKRLFSSVLTFFSYTLLIITIALVLLVGLQGATEIPRSLGGITVLRMTTDELEPEVAQDSFMLMNMPNMRTLSVGQIIAYQIDEDTVAIDRIYEIVPNQLAGEPGIIFEGDVYEDITHTNITLAQNIIGSPIFINRPLGQVLILFQERLIITVGVIVVVLIGLLLAQGKVKGGLTEDEERLERIGKTKVLSQK